MFRSIKAGFFMKTPEELRNLKKHDRSEYWALVERGVPLSPWDFGCPDWHHDETGAVNYWVPPPESVLMTDGDPARIPKEEQHYQSEKEETLYENCRVGWSRMVDQGLINDYWRHYWEWN